MYVKGVNNMLNTIFISSIVIILSIISTKFSSKLKIPNLLLFIGLGMFFGEDGIVRIPFDNFELAKDICATALIFIMFYGGFNTNWKTAKPVFVKAFLLSSVGVFLTTLLVGVFSYLVLKISFLESLLIGAIISSTDAASVFAILKTKKLALKNQIAPLLELESGSNDPSAYMLTIIILELIKGANNYQVYFLMIVSQFIVGTLVALGLAYLTLKLYRFDNLKANGLEVIYFVGMILFAFAIAEKLGGNGYLCIYIFGIIIGNQHLKNKLVIINFFDGLTGLIQICIFFLLGLLALPSQMPTILLTALIIASFLTLVARPLTVLVLLKPFKYTYKEMLLISFAGIRGASAIVFAIYAAVSFANLNNDVFHIIFVIVLLSIGIQGSLLPTVAKKLNLIDEDGDILKSFTAYQEEHDVQLVRFTIKDGHPWLNLKIKDINLPPQMLIVTIIKDNNPIIPNGETTIKVNDIVLITAPGEKEAIDIDVNEISINSQHEWKNKKIRDIKTASNCLIAIIKRDDSVIIPNGKTMILENDQVVIINKYQ